VKALILALNSRPEMVRLAAAKALARLRLPQARQALNARLKDINVEIAKLATAAATRVAW